MGLKAGEVAVGIAAAGILSSYLLSRRHSSKDAEGYLLVFEDCGKEYASGLAPNAVQVFYRPASVSALSLRKATGKALQVSKPETVRLWVQATKEEVTDTNLKSVLATTHGLSVVVLVCTRDGSQLSSEAASSAALQRFPSGPPPLPVVGNALALKNGPHMIPSFNAYANLFRGGEDKTLRIKLPIDEKGSQAKRYGLDYDPMELEGLIMTTDSLVVEELLLRQEDFPKMFTTSKAKSVQDFAGFGQFSNDTTSDIWKTGHGVLPKYFNAIRIKNYFPVVLEKTQVFIREWCKLGNGAVVEDVNDWLTCMTADAVTKAAMDYDMRNVERKSAHEDLHPFISAFRFGLGYAAGSITAKTEFGAMRAMNPFFDAEAAIQSRYDASKATCHKVVCEITELTRKGEIGGPLSLISGMLEAKSSTNGEFVHLADFYGHVINLMIAGHETTAATLAFCMAELVRNPECMAKAVSEIQGVMGNRVSPTYEDITKLPYVDACFNEALRMYAPVQMISRDAAKDTMVMGKYLVRKGQRFLINNCGLHRDSDQWDQGVFGDTNKFNPDRHLPGAPPRHPNAMIPFGFGVRGCMGMQFAILEARTFLCMMLNFFTFQLPEGFKITPSGHAGGAAPSPKDLSFTLGFRAGGPLDRVDIFSEGTSESSALTRTVMPSSKPPSVNKKTANTEKQLLVLYGSNSGTCEEFADQLAAKATGEGYCPEVMTLDRAEDSGKLPFTTGAVVIVTSTYNGQPPDNAAKFSRWLAAAEDKSQAGMQFAVFGVGNSNWSATYQGFPKYVHDGLITAGATQMMAISTADVSTSGFAEVFDDWMDDFMSILGVDSGSKSSGASKPHVTKPSYLKKPDPGFSTSAPFASGVELVLHLYELLKEYAKKADNEAVRKILEKRSLFQPCEVTQSVELQSEDSKRSTFHLELAFPSAKMSYEAGDHLEVLGRNSDELVHEALEVLGMKGEEVMELLSARTTFKKGLDMDLPSTPVTARMALQWLPDLSAPPTRKVLQRLASACPCPPEASALRTLSDEASYADKVLGTGMTLIEILQKFRSVPMDIEELCSSLPRQRTRFYSISSSPLVEPNRVSITVGLVEYHTKTGRHHLGFASGSLHSLAKGSNIIARVTNLNGKFKLPKDTTTPIIMVGPGTGVAPFMGFLEEREVLRKQGKKLGPAHLFFGCRCSTTDFIYKDTLESYTKSGVLSADGLHVAFSREEGQSKAYVQDLITERSEQLWALLQAGAIVYICGDAKRMAPGVKTAFVDVAAKHGKMSEVAAESWMGGLTTMGRYVEDVFA